MINDIAYIQRNYPEIKEVSFTSDSVIAKFRDGKKHHTPIEELKSALNKLQNQHNEAKTLSPQGKGRHTDTV